MSGEHHVGGQLSTRAYPATRCPGFRAQICQSRVRAGVAIDGRCAVRRVLTPPAAPRGIQAVAIVMQSYAGISAPSRVNPFSAV